MKFTAHACVGKGGIAALPAVRQWLVRAGVVSGPDLYARAYARFGIDEARDIRQRAHMRAWAAHAPERQAGRVFVIAATTITAEAQNALLKIFEEPPADASFILLVPAPHTLLPTLLSRMQELDKEIPDVSADSPIDATRFLAAAPAERIGMLKVLLDAHERDVGGAIAFLAACEEALGARLACEPRPLVTDGLRAVYRARAFIADKGALAKPLLEQLALLVP